MCGVDVHGSTVGIIGCGRIGQVLPIAGVFFSNCKFGYSSGSLPSAPYHRSMCPLSYNRGSNSKRSRVRGRVSLIKFHSMQYKCNEFQ